MFVCSSKSPFSTARGCLCHRPSVCTAVVQHSHREIGPILWLLWGGGLCRPKLQTGEGLPSGFISSLTVCLPLCGFDFWLQPGLQEMLCVCHADADF